MNAQEQEVDIKLDCSNTALLLKTINPIDLPSSQMVAEQIAAVKHYLHCKNCRDKGLDLITGVKLTCQDAILTWAKKPGQMKHGFVPGFYVARGNLLEEWATEHISGLFSYLNDRGGSGYNPMTRCTNRACRDLCHYWEGIPMSSSAGDGARGVIGEIPKIISIFIREGWPLDPILTIQEKRLHNLLKAVKKGDCSVGNGHYNNVGEVIEEIRSNFSCLKGMVLKT